jgi:hypothetical protein
MAAAGARCDSSPLAARWRSRALGFCTPKPPPCLAETRTQNPQTAMASLDSDPKEKPDGLAVQDASAINVKTLSPLTPEVISRQATINIGSQSLSLSILPCFCVILLLLHCPRTSCFIPSPPDVHVRHYQAQSDTWRTASRPSSRLFRACRPSASRPSWFATLPSSSDTQTPRSSSATTPSACGRAISRYRCSVSICARVQCFLAQRFASKCCRCSPAPVYNLFP